MGQPDYERAWRYALDRLGHELSASLRYHCLEHTRDSVVPAVDRLAERSGVSGEPLMLLRTAAHYHDLGFVVQTVGHEAVGAGIAAEVLPALGFCHEQVEVVRGMIMATKLPQSPHTFLEELLADADLDVLGREDFWAWNLRLRNETEALNKPQTDEQWYEGQLVFLRAHRYWTPAARELREAGKQSYIAEIEALLAKTQAVRPGA